MNEVETKNLEETPEKQSLYSNNLEMIPESKKEDSPDKMPLPIQEDTAKKNDIAKEKNTEEDKRETSASAMPIPESSGEIGQARIAQEQVEVIPLISDKKNEPRTVRPPSSKSGSRKNSQGATSSRKHSESKSTGKPQSLYEKALKGSKHHTKKKSLATQKVQKVEEIPDVMPSEDQVLFLHLRDTLLSLQRKDAIQRSTIEKIGRENEHLSNQVKQKMQAISKCIKTRETDGKTIAKQEEMIAKLRIEHQANQILGPPKHKSKKESAITEKKQINNLLEILKSNSFSLQSAQQIAPEIKRLAEQTEHASGREISGAVNTLCDLYDTLLEKEEQTVSEVKEYSLSRQKALFSSKEQLANSLFSLKKERLDDQKKILDLQRRLGYVTEEIEQDKTKLLKTGTIMGVDLNSEEHQMRDRVDDIMNNLREKIVSATDQKHSDMDMHKFLNRISQTNSPRFSMEPAS